MSVKKEIFGIHPSGKEVYKFEIMNKQGMKAVITNFGAILISLFVKDNGTTSRKRTYKIDKF